jgi:hypothetical protein
MIDLLQRALASGHAVRRVRGQVVSPRLRAALRPQTVAAVTAARSAFSAVGPVE